MNNSWFAFNLIINKDGIVTSIGKSSKSGSDNKNKKDNGNTEGEVEFGNKESLIFEERNFMNIFVAVSLVNIIIYILG